MRNGPYILQVAPENYTGKKYRGRYAYEHHIVWWEHHGRALGPDDVVHHINGNKHDNRIENLELLTRERHDEHHARERTRCEMVECAHCKTAFAVKPSAAKTRRKASIGGALYCSRSCGASAQFMRLRKQNPLPHGTRSGYMYHKCRCTDCRQWNTVRMREYKQRKAF